MGAIISFPKRFAEHRISMLKGYRAIWRLSINEDIYDLMSYKGEKQRYKYYASLAKKEKLWATTTIYKDSPTNDLNKNDDFIKNWRDYVENNYIKNIEIWACDFQGREKYSVILESQIQRSIQSNFSIGSHIHKEGMCWLGKIEYTGKIFDHKFSFLSYPDVDDDTKKLLINLSEKKIIKFQKVKYREKRLQKREYIKKVREFYPLAYTKWNHTEDKVLMF